MKFRSRFLLLTGLIFFVGCSLFEHEHWLDQSHIDYLVGIEESGKIKRELHFSSSEDKTVESDIEFIYDNDRLLKKNYTDYNLNEPYLLQMDTFIYENEKLSRMIHYFRTGTPTSPLRISEIYYYEYPDENTLVEVIYEENGELDDSIVYFYDNGFLVEDRYYSGDYSWGNKYEYNSNGKIFRTIDLSGENPAVNYFDESGILEKTISYKGQEERTIITYERKDDRNGTLTIYCYLQHLHLGWTEPKLTSHKKFINGQLVESVNYHPTFPGSEWWCHRYEYY